MFHTDNGGEFKVEVIGLLIRHKIKRITGRPRHPQTQEQVERANGALKTMFKKYTDTMEIPKRWYYVYLKVVLTYNNKYHDTIKMNSAEAFFTPREHLSVEETKIELHISAEDERNFVEPDPEQILNLESEELLDLAEEQIQQPNSEGIEIRERALETLIKSDRRWSKGAKKTLNFLI